MARRNSKQNDAAKTSQTADTSPLHWSMWILAGGCWLFLATALVSFSSADWPSHLVAVHNEPPSNLCGAAGSWIAYWAYRLLGLSAWLVIGGTGAWLVMMAAGRQCSQVGLRFGGLLVMAIALSGLHALILPDVGLMPGAPAGLIAHAATSALVPLFSTVGSFLILLAIFLVGAIIAADEFVLELPKRLMSSLGSRKDRSKRSRGSKGAGMLSALWSRPNREKAVHRRWSWNRRAGSNG